MALKGSMFVFNVCSYLVGLFEILLPDQGHHNNELHHTAKQTYCWEKIFFLKFFNSTNIDKNIHFFNLLYG